MVETTACQGGVGDFLELTKPRIVALVMASAFFGLALATARRVTPVNAGRPFRASLLYLPALLILMSVDRRL